MLPVNYILIKWRGWGEETQKNENEKKVSTAQKYIPKEMGTIREREDISPGKED